MEKKLYETPTMKVVKLQQQAHLLAGSDGSTDVQNYEWNNYEEE